MILNSSFDTVNKLIAKSNGYSEFCKLFDSSKPEITAALRQQIQAQNIALIDCLPLEQLSAHGTLSKVVNDQRFSLKLELLQHISKTIMHCTLDEWIFGKDLPIDVPLDVQMFLDLVNDIADWQMLIDLTKRYSEEPPTDARKIIAYRVMDRMQLAGQTKYSILRSEHVTVHYTFGTIFNDNYFVGRLNALAYVALIKLNFCSLDFLMEKDWSYKKNININGVPISPKQRRLLPLYLRLSPENQKDMLADLIALRL